METKQKKTFIAEFMDGANQGWSLGMRSMVTSLILANTVIFMLNASGILSIFEVIFAPIMAIFNLPGVAITALIAGFMSKPGGVGAAAALYAQGLMTAEQVTIVFPAIILMGAMLGQYVRTVVVSGADERKHGLLLGVCVLTALLSMFVMNGVLLVLGYL